MSEEIKVVPEKGHKALTAVLFIVFTIIVLGVLSIILIPKLIKDPVKTKDKNTFEINSEVKNSDLVEVNKNTKLDQPNELVDTSKLGEKTVDVIYIKGDKKEVVSVKINIVDTTKPEIKCEDKIEVYAGDKVDINELGTITDNSKEDIKPEITGEYDLTKEGEYKITIKAKDSSGNEATKDITLVVKKVELHTDGYYVYKTTEEWDEFAFRADNKAGYYPWFCPGSGCGGYGEEGTYKIEGNKITFTATIASNEGELSKVNNVYEFKYGSKDELIWIYKEKEYTLKWQKTYED